MPPRPPRLCAPQIVCRVRIVRRAQIVRRAPIVRCVEAEPPSTMILSHFSGGNPGIFNPVGMFIRHLSVHCI